MKHDDKYYIGRDSKGLFKWNEKELIRIEEPKAKKNEKTTPKKSRN
ncbi:hypothetical protein [Chryseobacterium daeguense]|nr:hypothetical protein [Chryseobacterium daeguense]